MALLQGWFLEGCSPASTEDTQLDMDPEGSACSFCHSFASSVSQLGISLPAAGCSKGGVWGAEFGTISQDPSGCIPLSSSAMCWGLFQDRAAPCPSRPSGSGRHLMTTVAAPAPACFLSRENQSSQAVANRAGTA